MNTFKMKQQLIKYTVNILRLNYSSFFCTKLKSKKKIKLKFLNLPSFY